MGGEKCTGKKCPKEDRKDLSEKELELIGEILAPVILCAVESACEMSFSSLCLAKQGRPTW